MFMNGTITRWLNHADTRTVAEWHALSEQEKTDCFYKNIEFGTGGLRGLMGLGPNRINHRTIAKVTAGYAAYIRECGMQQRGVVVAYDNRRGSREFAETTVGVLAAQGIKCYLFESLRTTPELSFAVRELCAFGGVVITASHNPPAYNGYKLYDETGAQLVPSAVEPIAAKISQVEDEFSVPILPLEKAGDCVTVIGAEVDAAYYERVLSLQFDAGTSKTVKIVYTPQHGAGNIPVRHVLEAAGFEVIPVDEQCNPDPDFSNTENPNPEMPEAHAAAIELMIKTGADLSIATDPDGDRLGVVVKTDDGCRLLSGNQSGALLLYYLLSRRKETGTLPSNGVMFTTVVTSDLGDAVAADFGICVEKTLTGFKYIGEKIRLCEQEGEKEFLFGYEESNGCLIGDFVRDKDGVQAALLFCEAADYYKKRGKTLWDVLQEIYDRYGRYTDRLVSVTLKGADGAEKIRTIMAKLRVRSVDEIAGLRVRETIDFRNPPSGFPSSDVLLYRFENGGFVAVRPSGTEPKCKFYYCVRGEETEGLERYFESLVNEKETV